jgi:hypothetical protein
VASPSREEQANNLLLAHLTPEQRETYKAGGWFEFKGKQGGKYRLYSADSLQVRGLTNTSRLVNLQAMDNSTVQCHNVWIENREGFGRSYAPEGEILLAFKTLMETNEENIRIGCVTVCYRSKLDL